MCRHKRRLSRVLAYLAALLIAAAAADAQPAAKIYRVGWLALNSPPNPFHDAFISGLRELGYAEGQNIVIESRWAAGHSERLPALAAELVRLRTNVIVTAAQAPTIAAKHATTTIPIVMVNIADPVGAGLIASFARPGGNITGLSYEADEGQYRKRLQLIKEAMPQVSRVALLFHADVPFKAFWKRVHDEAAPKVGLSIQHVEVGGPQDFEGGFVEMRNARADAVIVLGDPLIFSHRRQIIALAAKYKVPAVYTDRLSVEDGGLMTYASDSKDLYRRAAAYVDKILKGSKPTDLPVEQPTKFELVLNVKTAKALGLKISPSVVLRADQIIE